MIGHPERTVEGSAPRADDPLVTFRRIRAHLAPGLGLGQKITGGGALEQEASGAEIVLSDGRTMIDFGSYAVSLLGHRPPKVVAAVHAQLDLLPTSTRVLANETTPAFAERLVGAFDARRLTRVWLGMNGADAVEAALKLARVGTGRSRVLAVEGAFHGKTMGALAATWSPRYRVGLEPLLGGVTHVPLEPDAVAAELRRGDVAALIFEPIQGEGGIRPLDIEVVRRWCADARDAGALVIADEIQMGLHRCGPMSLAIEGGLEPDAVLLGKALGGGVMPLSAVVCTDAFYAPLRSDPFLHTAAFAGHPLSSAAGLAALDTLDELVPVGRRTAEALAPALADLASAFDDVIVEVRGRGLAWGLVCRSPEVAGELLCELAAGGLVVSPCLGAPEVIRLLPPMVTTADQMAEALAILAQSCAAARRAVGTGAMTTRGG